MSRTMLVAGGIALAVATVAAVPAEAKNPGFYYVKKEHQRTRRRLPGNVGRAESA